MTAPPSKKRKLLRHTSARENADILYKHDKYNVEEWMHVINRADRSSNLEEQRYVLTKFLEIFPTSSRQWKYYIELEISNNNYTIATGLFKKCLFGNYCYDVDLYKLYLNLCEKVNKTNKTLNRDEYNKNMIEGYQFAIKMVGQDISSTYIWRSYINFLINSLNNSSLNVNIMEIRKLYHIVIQLPISDVNKLFDEYIIWEKSLNKQLAESYHDKYKHLNELAYNIYLERKRYRRGILQHINIIPSSNIHKQNRNYQQIELWKKFIDYEISNKQNLSHKYLLNRIEFTFKQCLMTMSLFPDLWIIYIDWIYKNKTNKTIDIYKECIKRIPNCLLIRFKYCEYLEKYVSNEDADKEYLKLLNCKDLDDNKLVYIEYLYFLRRYKGMNGARNFFIQTVSSPHKFYEIFIAEGYIEEYINNDSACALRIFRNGFKFFKDLPEFLVLYVKFLMNNYRNKNDNDSKQELENIFNNILPSLNNNNSSTKLIWNLYIRYSKRELNITYLNKIETKRNISQNASRIQILLNYINRFKFGDLLPVNKQYYDTLINANKTQLLKQKSKQFHNNYMKNQNKLINNISIISSGITIGDNMTGMNNNNNNLFKNDMTLMIDDNNDINNNKQIIMPDINKLDAFKPGIRFLKLINNNDNEDESKQKQNGNGNDEDDVLNTYPAIQNLLKKLPPPQHTQLLKFDRNTSMIDIDAFVTCMRFKLKEDM